MTSRLLKKMRNSRRLKNGLLSTIIFMFTMVGFQNCAPRSQGFGDTSDSSGTATNASTNNSSGVSGFGSNTVNYGSGGSGGGSSGGGFNTGGSGGSGGGGGFNNTGGGSGGSDGGTTTVTSGALRILQQPVSVTVREGDNINLTVDIVGGTQPYTYQWYKDNQALTNGLGRFYFLADQANRYSKEGNYYLKVTDAAGATLNSAIAHVGILESQGPCDAAQYMMFNAPSKDPTGNFIGLFDNTHGKYLVNKSNSEISWMNSTPGYFDISYFNFTPALQDGQTASISCATQIDRIHNRQPNPDTSNGYYSNNYQNSYYWQYQGAVTFACHAQKYKFVSDTCRWVQVHSYATDNGGGGGR